MGASNVAAVLAGGTVDVGGFAFASLFPASTNVQLDPDGADIAEAIGAGVRRGFWLNFDSAGVMLAHVNAEAVATESMANQRITRNGDGELYLFYGMFGAATSANIVASDGSTLVTDITPAYDLPFLHKVAANGDTLLNTFPIDFGAGANGDSLIRAYAQPNSRSIVHVPDLDQVLFTAYVFFGNSVANPPSLDFDGTVVGPPSVGTMTAGEAGSSRFNGLARIDGNDNIVSALINSWPVTISSNLNNRIASSHASANLLVVSGAYQGQAAQLPAWGTDDATPVDGTDPPIATNTLSGWVAAYDPSDMSPSWVIEAANLTAGEDNGVEAVHVDAVDDNVYWSAPGLAANTRLFDRVPVVLGAAISVAQDLGKLIRSASNGDTTWQRDVLHTAANSAQGMLCVGIVTDADNVYALWTMPANTATDLVFGTGEPNQTSFTADAALIGTYLSKHSKATGDLVTVRQLMVRATVGGAAQGLTTPMVGLSRYPVSGNLALGVWAPMALGEELDFGNGQVYTFTAGDLANQFFGVEFDASLLCQGFTRIAESDNIFGVNPNEFNLFAN